MRTRLFLRSGLAAVATAMILAGCGSPAAAPHPKTPSRPAEASPPKTVVLPASAAIPAAARASLQQSVPTLNHELEQLDTDLSQLHQLLGG